MKNILLFGSGRSTSSLIKYLLDRTEKNQFKLHIANQSIESIQQKIEHNPNAFATSLDIHNSEQRKELIKNTDVVISMLPAFLHPIIATDCLKLGKHLVTASYISKELKAVDAEVKEKRSEERRVGR